MKAMVLCAGKGTRLGELTVTTPKVLLPVNGKPVVTYIIDWLKSYDGIDIVINLHYLGEEIRKYLISYSNILFTNEIQLLGTSGGVKNAREFLGPTFLVVQGDTLTNLDLLPMLKLHKLKKSLATIALDYSKTNKSHGVVYTDMFGVVNKFKEKPTEDAPGLFNTGVYIFEKEIFDYIPDGVSDFGFDVFPRITELGLPVYGFKVPPETYIIDIGTPEGYKQAKDLYEKR